MSEIKNKALGGLIALIMVILFFMGCAPQSATLDEDYEEDDQFQSELLDMLNSSDEGVDENSDFLSKLDNSSSTRSSSSNSGFEPSTDDDMTDVLSLLFDDEPAAITPAEKSNTLYNQPASSSSSTPSSTILENDVKRLENEYERKRMKADSLRRMVDLKNTKLRDLEAQKSTNTPAVNTLKPVRAGSASGDDVKGDSPYIQGYRSARSQFESFNYTAAIESFNNLLTTDPNNRLADNCQYWIGESYFGMKNYSKAIMEFQKVFAHQKADKHDDAQLMIAMSYLRSGDKAKARTEFEKFMTNYPDSEYRTRAQRILDKL